MGCRKNSKISFEIPVFKNVKVVLLLRSVSFWLMACVSWKIRKDVGGHVLIHNCVGGYSVTRL